MSYKPLCLAEVEQDLASVLVSQGITPVYAEKLAKCQAKTLHRKHQGSHIYWRRGRAAVGMDPSLRREIFAEWYEFGLEGKDGEGILATRQISSTTLDRIIREGRRNKWGAR